MYKSTKWRNINISSINALFFLTSWPQIYLPHLLPVIPLQALPPQSPPFLFRKEQVLHGFQQNMSYQVVIWLSTSSCIKAGQGNPIWRVKFQKPAEDLETNLASTVRRPTRWPNYTNVPNLQKAHCLTHKDFLVVNSYSMSSYEFRLIGFVSFLMLFLTTMVTTKLPLSVQQDSLRSVQCLTEDLCLCSQ